MTFSPKRDTISLFQGYLLYKPSLKMRVCNKGSYFQDVQRHEAHGELSYNTEWKSQNWNPGLYNRITDNKTLIHTAPVSLLTCLHFRLAKFRDWSYQKWAVGNLTALKSALQPLTNYSGHVVFNCSLIFLFFLNYRHSKG